MPTIKVNHVEYSKTETGDKKWEKIPRYIEIPYYCLVFKNDLIETTGCQENKILPVWRFGYSSDNISGTRYYIFGIDKYGVNANSITEYYLFKRPFKNWIKYLLVLITKRYVK